MRFYLILFVNLYFSSLCAENNSYPNVSASISDVETHRVGNRVVRLIRSFSGESFLFIELLKPPKFSLINKRVIDKIKVTIDGRDRVLDFRDTAGVSFKNIVVEKGVVKFWVEFHIRRGSGYYLSECEVDANRERLPEPVCRHIPGHE